MKKLLPFFVCFLSFPSFSQDWAPFPYRQKSWFQDNAYVMDSVRQNGEDSILYFKRKWEPGGTGPCDIVFPDYLSYGDIFELDSLILRNDTVFYHSTLSSIPFYFLPKASPGQSWTSTSDFTNNSYQEISITCESVSLETFLGITDSVKTFSMLPDGFSPGQTPISDFRIKLSKHHGFVELVPFVLFHYHPAYQDFYVQNLFGTDSSGSNYGYSQPDFSAYFHLSPGDILHWEEHHDSFSPMFPDVTSYHRDSITQTFSDPDSVVYTFDRITLNASQEIITQNGLQTTFRRSEFGDLLVSAPKKMGLSNNFLSSYGFQGAVLIWRNDFKISIDSISGDTITRFLYVNDGPYLDTVNCNIHQFVDAGTDFTLDTEVGLRQFCTWLSGSSNCTKLIAYRINGIQTGNTNLGLEELNPANATTLRIFPNPAQNELNFTESNTEIKIYSIFDLGGKLILSGENPGKSIAISGLESGIYFIHMEAGKQIFNGKFVKE